MSSRRGATSALTFAVLTALLLPAAPARAQEGPIDLLSRYDIRIDGSEPNGYTGYSVAGGGDVNGDGTPDAVVGAPFTGLGGEVYVVFGDPAPGAIDAGNLGDRGFQILGAATGDDAGIEVAMAGDVNDDGLDDVVVGTEKLSLSEEVYVVFGKTDTATVDLASLGSGGFVISTTMPNLDHGPGLGLALDGAGYVNDDDFADIIIGAPYSDNNSRQASGSAYVIFGKDTTTPIDVGSLGSAGYVIDGAYAYDHTGISVNGAHDVNGDGRDDVVLGARYADYKMRTDAGAAIVVYGKTTTTAIDIASLGPDGFVIGGADASDYAGVSVAGVGDVNEDGFVDIAVGAQLANQDAEYNSGSVYVVFGEQSPGNVDLASFANKGFRIDVAPAETGDPIVDLGQEVAAAGDVNADGKDDVLVSSARASNNDRPQSGSAYVVYGTAGTDTIPLASLGSNGFRMDGPRQSSDTGFSLSGAGDVDGDGQDDVLVGAPRREGGSVYLEMDEELLDGECANLRPGTDEVDILVGSDMGDDMTGGDEGDDLSGEGGDDCVDGEAGPDIVKGGEGDDTVKGGTGHDTTIDGGDGNDTINGGDGNDADMSGGSGDDTMDGGDGGDTLDGGLDVDDVSGGRRVDTLYGGKGRDDLDGGKGDDTVVGEDGHDTLTGGPGGDTIQAGPGDDEIHANDGEVDTIECGQGSDTVFADPQDNLTSC